MEESEETETLVVKKPSNTLFNYFAKPLKPSTNNGEPVKNKIDEVVVKKGQTNKDDDDEKTYKEDNKENSKKRSVVKVKPKKKRKKVESSASEEDAVEEEAHKKKRMKKSNTQNNKPTDVAKVVELPKLDVLIDSVVDDVGDNDTPVLEESTPEELTEAKPRTSISNFFTKVSKKERLSIVEKESSQVEVKVMVHESPDEKCKVTKVSEKKRVSKKPRKSNVARSGAETDKINVLEVTEIKDDSVEVKLELDSNMAADEASGKISTKLFSLKRKNRNNKPAHDESDASINMESLENTPIKKDVDTVVSPVKKSSKVGTSERVQSLKSAFSVLMSKNTEAKSDDGSEVVNEISGDDADSKTRTALVHVSSTEVPEDKSVQKEKSKAEKSTERTSTGTANAFTFLMSKKKPIEKVEDDDDLVIIEEQTTVEETQVHEVQCDIKEKSEEVVWKIKKSSEIKNNVFLTLMKNSRKSFEPPPEEKEEFPDQSVVAEIKNDKIPEDVKLKNMLSVLQSVEDESENDCVITDLERKERRKSRKKAKLKTKARKKEPSPVQSEEDGDDLEEVDIEVVAATDDVDIHEVRCRRAVGEFHLSKFISGGKGESVYYEGSWMTPSTFEREAGSRSKKYKSSLFVNNKPIIKLLDAKNISTPSRSNSSSGRSTPVEDRATPTPENTPKRKGSKKKRNKRIIESDDENIPEDKEASELDEEEPSGRRSSGRIARNLVALQEQRKQEDELEKAEKEMKKKRKAEEKKKKEDEKLAKKEARMAKKEAGKTKKSLPSSSSESDSDASSDCEIEEVVVKSKKTSKLASIFTGGKNAAVVKPLEDPAVTAARRAFLMSSAPEVLKTQLSEDKMGDVLDDGGVIWPGEETLASHTQQKQDDLFWTLKLCLENIQLKTGAGCVVVPVVAPGQLAMEHQEERESSLTEGRLNEADVMASLERWAQGATFPVKRIFSSFVERKVEAESFEREAREKNLSVQEVEEKRIRGNRRRSRRSREGRDAGADGKYVIQSGSGLMWTGKYQPRGVGDMLGNSEELGRMREWLRGWVGGRKGSTTGGSTSDTGSEWASEAGSEYESVGEGLANTALLEGETGVGKSAAVYALAAEMGFNVLEVNASSCRTGRQVLAMLAEATQSQQVRRETEKAQNMFSKKEQDKSDSKKMKTALILFEDVNLVFGDLDDGFYGAVNTLSQQSKRPIIMTVSSCHWLGQGMGGLGEKLLKFSPLVFRLQPVGEEQLVNSLQVMALVEGFKVGKVDIREMVISCRGVRQCVLQLQLLCESGLVRGAGREEESLIGDHEQGEEKVDVRKWFKHIDSKTRRKGVVPDSSGFGGMQQSVDYFNDEWWRSFSGKKKETCERVERYPLKEGEGVKGVYSRIDPLKNKDLFDTEGSEEEMEVDSKEDNKNTINAQPKGSRSLASKSLAAKNLHSLSNLSKHLDLVSEFCPQSGDTPWHVLPPVGDSTAQVFPDHRETKGEEGNSLVMLKEALIRSGELVKQKLEKVDLQIFTLEEDKKYKDTVSDSQAEVYYGGLVDTYMLDRVGRTEMISGMRGLARGEEHRRVMVKSTGKRSKRFTHFFAQNEVFLGQETLDRLCNALCD